MCPLGIKEGIWNVRMQIGWTNHATHESGVLTVCHNEQPYLHQNKIFLWCSFRFWFLMISECYSGCLEADYPADWCVIFSFMIKVWTWYRKSSWQVDMSRKMGHSTWSCLGILCWHHPNVYLCYVWSQIKKSAIRRSCFGGDMAAHCGRQWAHQFYVWHGWYMLCAFWHFKCLPICLMRQYQKKRHKNNQYWWRYCHFLLLTVVNSEQDVLRSDRNQLHFLHSNMVDRCIYI